MSSINGIGIGLLPTLSTPKKSAATSPAMASTPFGDLLSKQGLAIGNSNASPAALTKLSPADTGTKSSAASEFEKYMEMTPAEKIRYNMLQDMGLTEDELKALPPEQQNRIETAIANRIKEQLQATANASNGADSNASTNGSNAQTTGGPTEIFQAVQANNSDQRLLDIYS